jgi:hypothetical protein
MRQIQQPVISQVRAKEKSFELDAQSGTNRQSERKKKKEDGV